MNVTSRILQAGPLQCDRSHRFHQTYYSYLVDVIYIIHSNDKCKKKSYVKCAENIQDQIKHTRTSNVFHKDHNRSLNLKCEVSRTINHSSVNGDQFKHWNSSLENLNVTLQLIKSLNKTYLLGLKLIRPILRPKQSLFLILYSLL